MKESKASTMRRRYARLPLALALGAMVLTPAVIGIGASEAEASVAGKGETSITLSGDARLRGFWREDADFGNRLTPTNETTFTDSDTNAQLQHRMRLYFDAKAAGGTSLHARLLLAANNSADRAMYQWGGARNSNMATDYFYVNVPVGPVNVLAGRHLVNWGHRMKAWDARADRLRVNYKVNDELTVFGYYQKDVEAQGGANPVRAAEDEDQNRYSLGMVYNTADLRLAAQIRHTDQEWDNGNSGQEFYGFGTYKMNDLTADFEFDWRFGDFWENANGDKGYAFMLVLAYAMGDTTLTAGGAYAGNGWTAGAGGIHFDQVTMFYNTGGGHSLGHTNFGAASDDKEWALGVGVKHNLSPELTLGAKLAYVDMQNNVAIDDASVWAVDASMAYKVNASTTYHIDAIYAKPSFDDPTLQDDAYWGLSHRFEIRF